MSLALVGLNHTTAPVEVRERLAMSDEDAIQAIHLGQEWFHEMVCISTCNRTEIYAVPKKDPTQTPALVQQILEKVKGDGVVGTGEFFFVYQGHPAVEHLFRVASGLDSLMVGEKQILGQIKAAYSLASKEGSTGIVLNRLFQSAFHTGKRAQTETEIGSGAVSVSYAAVGMAERVFGDLSSKRALVVGAGNSAALAARHLIDTGFGNVDIANRTFSRAEELCAELGATPVRFEELPEALIGADVIVSSTGATEHIITYDMLKTTMRKRPDRLLLILDIAVPRDVEPRVNTLHNVLLHDMDALEVMVAQNLTRRQKEIPAVETIVREVRDEFIAWYSTLSVTPIIKAMRSQIEAIRRQEVDKFAKKLQSPDREALDQITRSVVNKILHLPTAKIREFSDDAMSAVRLDTVLELFGLTELPKHGDSTDSEGDL